MKTADSNEYYLCAGCFQRLADPEDLARISGDKTQHTFTNPAGFVYQILTFSACTGYKEASPPTLQNTWFPGYSWSVINCHRCGNLLGWKYTGDGTTPAFFFGLIRQQLILG